MIRYLTAGESHGKCLTAIIEGIPSNLSIDIKKINQKLAQRQGGFGRGGRMKIETDTVEVLSGIRDGKTLGSPITLKIENKDWSNWENTMNTENITNKEEITRPRPGHADLAGSIKYNHTDIRNVLERASARETAIRVAVGSICIQLLELFNIKLFSHVIQIANIKTNIAFSETLFNEWIDKSSLRCLDPEAERLMVDCISEAKAAGDTVGGIFEIIAAGVPIGLGSHVNWDRKLDARIAGSLTSIQAIKGVEFGIGFKYASISGSQVHDEIFYKQGQYNHKSNNSGGIEGGISNGEDIVVKAVMKPIPTLYKPLKSVDMATKEPYEAVVERSDVCAVSAAGIVGESAVAWEIACAMVEKFGGDSIGEMLANYRQYIEYVKSR